MDGRDLGGRPNGFNPFPIDGKHTLAAFPLLWEEKKVSSPKAPKTSIHLVIAATLPSRPRSCSLLRPDLGPPLAHRLVAVLEACRVGGMSFNSEGTPPCWHNTRQLEKAY